MSTSPVASASIRTRLSIADCAVLIRDTARSIPKILQFYSKAEQGVVPPFEIPFKGIGGSLPPVHLDAFFTVHLKIIIQDFSV